MSAIATVAQITTPFGGVTVRRPDRFRAGWDRPVSDFTLDQDSRLVERCLDGDEAAWEELVRTQTRRVYAICYRFTNDTAAAEDITQEVFLRVFRSLKTYRSGSGTFAVWLSRLTRNLLIDHYRRGKMDRATDSIDDQVTDLRERSAGAQADARLEEREAGEVLQLGLARLSPELRETVILRDLEGMEYREIADVLNVPEGTVKSRLNRGRAELGRVLRRLGVQQ